MTTVKHLAKIESAGLEITDRGILTFYIQVHYEDGFHQNIGGFCLDAPSQCTNFNTLFKRVGTAYGCEMIRQLLLCLEVNDLHEAGGRYIHVIGEESSGRLSFKPLGIERLGCDDYSGEHGKVIFSKVFEMFEGEKK